MPLPSDYLERIYAGVIGKVIGVYLGRPIEGWTREKILSDLGHIRYYVHDKYDHPLFPANVRPLVVIDDDVSGTFFSFRALQEHDALNLTAEDIGKTWYGIMDSDNKGGAHTCRLNNIVEERSVFWWGGKAISTEHTAYLNLKNGIPAPLSGAIEMNGQVVAEQVGGEIFMDAFALCAAGKPPTIQIANALNDINEDLGNPQLAAHLARQAASVSHDGEAIYGAITWAVMEAEAFNSKDVNHLIDTSLQYIPSDCVIAKSTADIRKWAKADQDWEVTRQRIEEIYGNESFQGACSVIPNHSILILALVYGGHSFDEGMHIQMTCGWDTDSNGGNMGCLLGVMHGLAGFEKGSDWRGPLADRTIISSADGGYAINNCARLTLDLAQIARKLAGESPLPLPKEGAQYHFTLPGSVQGFQVSPDKLMPNVITVGQGQGPVGPALAIRLNGLTIANGALDVMTDTFMRPEYLPHSHYDLQASPLIYPGQKIQAVLHADGNMMPQAQVRVTLRLGVYSSRDSTLFVDGPSCVLKAKDSSKLVFTIPDSYDSQPIRQIGFALNTTSAERVHGTIWLDSLSWSGSPRMTLQSPKLNRTWPGSDSEPWRRMWIDNTSMFHWYMPAYTVSRNVGEGGLFIGTRDWFDYSVTARNLETKTPNGNGLVARYQGLRRWYGLLFRPGEVAFVKAMDEERITLAKTSHDWKLNTKYDVTVVVQGKKMCGYINGSMVLQASDEGFASGGIGILVKDGSMTVEKFDIEPVE